VIVLLVITNGLYAIIECLEEGSVVDLEHHLFVGVVGVVVNPNYLLKV
jgi:hypothetical protein